MNDADIIGSEVFLRTLMQERLVNGGTNQHLVALGNNSSLIFVYLCVSKLISQKSYADCGSGIGRIAKNLLIRYFNEVNCFV